MNAMIVRMCRGGWERFEVGSFITQCYASPPIEMAMTDGCILHGMNDQEPTSAARNLVCQAFLENTIDVLLMVDNDMSPHLHFFNFVINFLYKNPGPFVIGSPYCGARPQRKVQVKRLIEGGQLEHVSRKEALTKTGIEQVWCVGTGLIAIHRKAFSLLEPPYFDYEYTNEAKVNVATTEDFYFTRRLSEASGRVMVAWDHWSGHGKEEVIGKPTEGDA